MAKKEKRDRTILSSDYALVIAKSASENAVLLISATKSGNAKTAILTERDLGSGGRYIIYKARPIPADDDHFRLGIMLWLW